MKHILFFPLMLAGSLLLGQDQLKLHKVPVSDVYPLIKRESKIQVYLFSVNDGPQQPVGLMGEEIEPYLMKHDEAYALFLKFRKKAAGARTTSAIAAGVSGVGLAGFFGFNESDSDLTTAQIASIGAMVVGLAGSLWAGAKTKKSRWFFEESVRVFNQQ